MKTVAAALVLTLWAGAALADCATDRVDLRGDWGQAAAYVVLSVGLSVGGLAVGLVVARSLA